MIKTILWDFDGVILDSMKIKGDGFVELFSEFDLDDVRKLETFHYKNGGISRFAKIKYFYNKVLKRDIEENEVLVLADKFGEIIEKKLYDEDNLIQETIDFIEKNISNYNFHIVSGAEDIELNSLCKYFKLDKFFLSIKGSPVKKDILVKNILDQYCYKKEETILIGDSINDYEAATINGIDFYGFNNEELRDKGKMYISDYEGFLQA